MRPRPLVQQIIVRIYIWNYMHALYISQHYQFDTKHLAFHILFFFKYLFEIFGAGAKLYLSWFAYARHWITPQITS